jgi:predicted Fe-Mo cluster-binding NifX family protein
MEKAKMKIAAATNDGTTISARFGRARQYAVFTVDDGEVGDRELREKGGPHDFEGEGLHKHWRRDDPQGRGFGPHVQVRHKRMIAPIADCQVVLTGSMGQGAYIKLKREGIRPILTDITDIDTAVRAVIEGTIVNHLGRLR